MKRGYIKIEENDSHEFSVEARLVNRTLWLSAWEIAALFNVYTQTIEGILKTIFKTGLLREDEVSQVHAFVNNGRECLITLYNLEVLVFVSYRIASFEVRAFWQWVLKALTGYARENEMQKPDILIMYNLGKNLPLISLN